MTGTVDTDTGHVRAQRRGPAPDLLNVEHHVGGVHVLAHLGGIGRTARGEHEGRRCDLEPAVELRMALAYGAQPPGVDRPGLERLPVEVEVELAFVVVVQ